ncbi:MAG TPA: DUF559 domain-containing protein [Devosia sp.]|nr:DUF559 domain-containing protein [Devosia sp.]
MRRNSTDVETILWQELRDRRLGGHKFRRQATVGPYVADFLCAEKRLIVELGGGQHGVEADARRTAELVRLGYRVIRFWNNELTENRDAVLERILAVASDLPSRFRTSGPSSRLR